jgi:L-alanine-DL-glutamate epimerase-like enolase superfamily enzyme
MRCSHACKTLMQSKFNSPKLVQLANATSSKIELIWQTIYRLSFYRGGPVLQSALSGIDIALWDLKGKGYNSCCSDVD